MQRLPWLLLPLYLLRAPKKSQSYPKAPTDYRPSSSEGMWNRLYTYSWICCPTDHPLCLVWMKFLICCFAFSPSLIPDANSELLLNFCISCFGRLCSGAAMNVHRSKVKPAARAPVHQLTFTECTLIA